MKDDIRNKFSFQDSQYDFPYHYIPHFNSDGTPSLIRELSWGLEYLCYQHHIKEKVLNWNPRSVLEIGCGDGYFIGKLMEGISDRVGVDLSKKAISFAKSFHSDCMFYTKNAGSLNREFDVVVAIEVIEHIPDGELPDFFRTLENRVTEEGRILISVPTTIVPLNKKHYRHYTLELLEQQLLKNDTSLKLVEYEYIYAEPVWLRALRLFLSNRLFCLEVKPLMRYAWRKIWYKYRISDFKNGRHLVAVIQKST